MSSFLNSRATKKKFEEFHQKMKIWDDRKKYRRRLKDKYKRTSTKIMN